MAEFKDRLEEALTMRNMKPAELSKLTGIGEGAISQYRKGAYKATQRNLEKISKVLNVPVSWLMGSTDTLEKNSGEKYPLIPASPILLALAESVAQLNDEGQEKLVEYADDLVSSGKYKKYGSLELDQEA